MSISLTRFQKTIVNNENLIVLQGSRKKAVKGYP